MNRSVINLIDGSTFGAKMPRVSWEFMSNLLELLPAYDEQREIVEFIDCETAKIDALTQKQEWMIELLKRSVRPSSLTRSPKDVCREWYPFFLTALRAGLRKGELIALKWGDIQFGDGSADRYILVQRNWACDEFTSPKSKKSRRVDVSWQLRQVLMDLRDERLLAAYAQRSASISNDLVFPFSGWNSH